MLKACRYGSLSIPPARRPPRRGRGARQNPPTLSLLELVWADSSYNARQVKDTVAKVPRLRVEIVKRSDDMKGFVVLPRRWVVERTFSWFGRNRRLAKDYEKLAQALATFNALAAIQLGVKAPRKEVCF